MRTDNSALKIIKLADSTFEFDHLTLLFESNSMCHNLRFEIFLSFSRFSAEKLKKLQEFEKRVN